MSQNLSTTAGVDSSFKDFALHPELALSIDAGVATLEMCRPPYNFFDESLIVGLVDALRYLDTSDECRVVVLASRGKTFCAGADFSNDSISSQGIGKRLYSRALEMFRTKKPIVCAVQGAAVGGGLGLALVGDFRVVSPGTRMVANFLRLGIHPGFGLTATLPRLVGPQNAAMLFYTGRRIGGVEALDMGLADVLVEDGRVLEGAQALAREIAISAPIALVSTRETLHQGLAALVEAAMGREAEEQDKHWLTQDFKEGVAAMAARRDPVFKGY
ncbi:enoyl-CoA hydratase/isomerase family protein [Glaciimonas sp. Cout2]|nr:MULTISPECIES: enoyl-CoA hydratase/isomerase family protein [unclassified Glaciimonas]MEB0011051.1 enoyl-CoA hydratase/isomerase family protein [Glaciimonas sp. Cout2]